MKVLQVTNIVSHHQLPLARQIVKLIGAENFRFAATQRPDTERTKNGWASEYSDSWILHPSECAKDQLEFDTFWDQADVVLCGERLIGRMEKRIKEKKICFYISERWWKPPLGCLRLLHPGYLKMARRFRNLSRSRYFHYLPTGHFAEKDWTLLTAQKERVWRWGYFTEMPEIKRISLADKRPIKILWIGRMLRWKRVDLLIDALNLLKRQDVMFHLTLIGDGPERSRLETKAFSLLGRDKVTMEGFVKFTEVHHVMAGHDIYVLPSNSYEGWGAVVNEAMAMGCTVVVSDQTGAGKSLITSGYDGLLFKSGSISDLSDCLHFLASNDDARSSMSRRSMDTMRLLWSPAVAAERFIDLSSNLIIDGTTPDFFDGPLSKSTLDRVT